MDEHEAECRPGSEVCVICGQWESNGIHCTPTEIVVQLANPERVGNGCMIYRSGEER